MRRRDDRDLCRGRYFWWYSRCTLPRVLHGLSELLFLRNSHYHIAVNMFPVHGIPINQAEITQPVDHTGDALAEFKDTAAGVLRKQVRGTAGVHDPVLYVAASLVGIQATEVVIHADTLRKLGQFRPAQFVPQLALPDHDDLQDKVFLGIDVGQHAQFFQRFHRQVLRLIDNQ